MEDEFGSEQCTESGEFLTLKWNLKYDKILLQVSGII